jgi:hypothetical protein
MTVEMIYRILTVDLFVGLNCRVIQGMRITTHIDISISYFLNRKPFIIEGAVAEPSGVTYGIKEFNHLHIAHYGEFPRLRSDQVRQHFRKRKFFSTSEIR